jgi:hypothetical protein
VFASQLRQVSPPRPLEQRDLDDAEMTPVRRALQQVLGGQDPYPAVVIDGDWEMIAANRGPPF